MQTNECVMCGGNDFTVTDGAFVCNECGIQSQTLREEQIEFNENIPIVNHDDIADYNHEITAGSQLDKAKKLLSWECFNLILLGLTKEMIGLGAKPSLKVIVLQLWVLYLQCIEAAFTSKKFKKLPKFNTAINNIDCEILYGVENIKRKLLLAKTGLKTKEKKHPSNKRKSLTSNNSSITSAMTASQKRCIISRKLRKLESTKKQSNNDSTRLSDDISLLQRSNKSSKIKIKLTKTTKKSLTSLPSINKDLTIEESTTLLESGKKYWKNLKCKEKKNVICVKKLISIIQLALMINNDDIYLSDILRWSHQGHLHVNRVNLFLPENARHGIHLTSMVNYSSRNKLNIEMTMILNHLKANQLPNIDFKKLVIKFSDELQLPSDFTHFVCKLLSIYPPSLKCTQGFPDIEVKIMAYILFAAKFLFYLDDNAENLSSDFANKVNQSNKVEKQLFSWNEYVLYMECRNSVTSEYNYLLHTNIYGNNIRNTELFVNNWNIMKSTLPITKKEELSKQFRTNTECLLKSLPDVGNKRSYREIPPFTKPLSSTLKWIFEYYPMCLSIEAKRKLEYDFTDTDILYLTDEKRINDLAKECDISIQVNCSRPYHYVKQSEKDSDTKCSKSYTAKSTVYLINKQKSVINNEQKKIINDSYEENPNTIYLGTGFNYWSKHISKHFLKRADITKINTVLKTQLPYSFLWFMKQCCTLLDCSLSEIYVELINIEKQFSTLLQTCEVTHDETGCEEMFSNISL